jgi:lysophospholipid acyltransferase
LTFVVTQFTFSFATVPFLVLSFSGSMRAWSGVYFYAFGWTLATLAFFNTSGKVMLRKELEKRTGTKREKLVRTTSTDSIGGREPILGISKDPEQDINEVIKEIRAEVEAQQKKKQL